MFSIHGVHCVGYRKICYGKKDRGSSAFYIISDKSGCEFHIRSWLIRRKARVRVPGQMSKRNTKSISSAIFSQQISGKNSDSELKLP